MIFGKTYRRKQIEMEKKNDIWFAWRPVHLNDGRWAWWQQVKRESRGFKDCLWYVYFENKG